MTALLIRRLFALPPWTLGPILAWNLIPVVGVVVLGWDAGQILMLYWAENLAVGAASLIRILTARGDRNRMDESGFAGRLGLGCFFTVHYGIFCMVHGVFAASMVTSGGPDAGLWRRSFGDPDFRIAVLAAAALQIIPLARDWWLGGAWRRHAPGEEMFRPYGRIVVLHVSIIFGAAALNLLDAPAGAVLILCLLKTIMELTAATFTTEVRSRGGAS